MKRKHDPRKRCQRLARQLIIHGKRHIDSDDDFIGGIKRRAPMSEGDMVRAYNWATQTPNLWVFIARVYCRADDGTDYVEEVEAETRQGALVNSLSEWRMGLLAEAKAGVNPKHIVAEGFEYRLAGGVS